MQERAVYYTNELANLPKKNYGYGNIVQFSYFQIG